MIRMFHDIGFFCINRSFGGLFHSSIRTFVAYGLFTGHNAYLAREGGRGGGHREEAGSMPEDYVGVDALGIYYRARTSFGPNW